jgi:hypothetical protein
MVITSIITIKHKLINQLLLSFSVMSLSLFITAQNEIPSYIYPEEPEVLKNLEE